jgi:hypothetical protein
VPGLRGADLLVPVAIDRDDLEIAALSRLASHIPLRAVYVMPHHQYPMTVTLKAARRLAFVALVRTGRIAIIEHSWHTGRRYAFEGQSAPFAGFSFACLDERELPEAVSRMAAARP